MNPDYKILFEELPISIQKKINFEKFCQDVKIFGLIGLYILDKKLYNLRRIGFIVGRTATRSYAVTCNFNLLYNNKYNYDIRPVYYNNPRKFVKSYIKYSNIINLESEKFMEIPEVVNIMIKNKII